MDWRTQHNPTFLSNLNQIISIEKFVNKTSAKRYETQQVRQIND